MKYIFKTDSEVLFEVMRQDLTEEIEKSLRERFGNSPVKKFELEFAYGVTVEDCGYLDEIDAKKVSVMTLTLKEKA